MEITAKLLLAKEVQEISPTFSKREVIVETTDSQYPQEIQLEFHGDRTDLIDSYNIGDTLKFSINLRGRKFEKIGEPTRWFNSIICWRVEKV